jgi:hypothetical protein
MNEQRLAIERYWAECERRGVVGTLVDACEYARRCVWCGAVGEGHRRDLLVGVFGE